MALFMQTISFQVIYREKVETIKIKFYDGNQLENKIVRN